MSAENRYDRSNVDNMEMLYGRGFLSGGGADEVALIFDGIDLRDADVLDLGCGLGGATVAMLTRLDAKHVTGFDVDAGNLERAEELLAETGMQSRATLVEGTAGPLPFETDSFDCVYVNAVSCHLEGLAEFFAEIRRVLRPEGVLVGSEWLVREDNAAFQGWDDLLRERGLSFHFVDTATFVAAVEEAGLIDVSLVDRTAAFTEFSRELLERTDTELRKALVDSLGEVGFDAFRKWCEVRYVGQSSLNDAQAQLDSDGKFRCVISTRDPGVPNWLDKGNVPWGVVQLRWNLASDFPDPSMKKVAFDEIRDHLPDDTPVVTAEQRVESLRRRREGAQLRRIW